MITAKDIKNCGYDLEDLGNLAYELLKERDEAYCKAIENDSALRKSWYEAEATAAALISASQEIFGVTKTDLIEHRAERILSERKSASSKDIAESTDIKSKGADK